MRGRCRRREGTAGRQGAGALLAAVIAALCWSAAPAGAQLLDLGAPAAPRPGDGKAALAIAQSLFDDIAKREKGLTGLGGNELAAAEFEIATRRLVRVLLMKAEELGEPGSAHALAALTLHGRQRELDAIARRIRTGRLSPEASAAAAVFVAQVAEAQSLVPGRVEDLDRMLRDLFAMPVHTGLAAAADAPVWQTEGWRVGWVPERAGDGTPVDLAAAIGRWAVGAGGSEGEGEGEGESATEQRRQILSAELLSELGAFEAETLAPGREWWAYRGAAESTAAAIVSAGRAVEPGALPEWVPETTRAGLAARFAAAAGAALNRETRAESAPYLADLAACVELLTRLEALSTQATGPARPSQRAVASARTALLAIIAATETGSAESRSSLAAFDGALRLIGRRGELGGEEGLIRDARPAWRALEAEARRTEQDLWEVLGKIGTRGSGPMSDPAVVGPLAAHRRSLSDLRAVAAISHWLNATPGGETPGRTAPATALAVQQNLAAQKVLRLGQDLSVTTKRDAALATIRRFAADLEALMLLPGEGELRIGGPAWAALTGGHGADLLGRIDALRSEWLNAWVQDRDGAGSSSVTAAAEGLGRLRGVMLALHDAATVREILTAPRTDEGFAPGAEGVILAWPGWELSDRAARALYDGVEPRLAAACGALLSGSATSADAVDDAIEAFAKERAPLRLAAALEREARMRRIAGVPVLVELAAPPGLSTAAGGPWLDDLRADLAAVCRYSEEYALATADKDRRRAEALRDYLGERSLAALQRLEAMGRAE